MSETSQESPSKVRSEIIEISILFLILILISFTSFVKYLLFHSIAEIFSIIIMGGIFFIGWNSRKYMKSSFFLILGISSLFIGAIDLIHTLSYSGMQIFEGFDANLPTSLWIAARYLQAFSLLGASYMIKRRIKPIYLIFLFLIVSIVLVYLIFTKFFPVCYIEDLKRLTLFKIASEYIINFILLVSIFKIIRNRFEFDQRVFLLILSSIVATIIAELAFTFYFGVKDIPNFIGHIFKIIAFYLLYKSIIQIGFDNPFNLLFRKIKRHELELGNIIKHSGAGITMVDKNGTYLLVNEKAAIDLGGSPEDFIGKTLYDVFPKKLADEYYYSNRELIQKGINRAYQRTFDLSSGEKTYWIVEQPLKDIDEKNYSLLSITTDITERKKSEELLEEAELRFRTTFEQSPDGIIILDTESLRAVEFNDAVLKILGYTREEFQNLKIHDYDYIEDQSGTKAHVETVLKKGRDDFKTKFITKNGEIRDIYVIAKVIKLLGKTYFQSIFRDITVQKRAEDALKQREYDLKERVKELTCLYNISKLIDQIDISIKQVLEKTLTYIPQAWQYSEITSARIVYKELEFKTVNFEVTEWCLKIDIKEYGKSVGFIEVSYLEKKPENYEGPFLKEERDLINGISEMLSLFIERKKSEERVYNLSKFPSENPYPVLRIDNKLVIYTNQAGNKLFNVLEGSLVPKMLTKSINKAIDRNEIQELEINLDSRTYTLVISPVENENYVNVYGMDITERKNAEERLSRLISTVSHELRTPITVLLMSIEYLTKNREALNEDLEEKLMDGISRNIQLLNQLAEDILLISRIDEKKLKLEWEQYKPLEIITDILYLMEPIGMERNIEFELDIDENIILKGDIKRIDQVFRIIIDNALKFSNENSKVEIRAIKNYQGKYNLKSNLGVLFQFKDHGRGIPKEDLPNIFERFFRSSNVNEIAGTGLGLSIAKDLVKAHNGNIFVESELEKGTTLFVFLPQIE